MDYYISDEPLRLREFGRNVQAMVEYAMSIENRDRRNQVAQHIIRIMANLNPSLTENPDYEQKLWDSIFIISDFELDVDAPYPPPTREMVQEAKPDHMGYYREKSRYKQYGKNVELMIAKAKDMEDDDKRVAYINLIANTMKQFLRNAHKENIPDEVITEHIKELSGGAIDVGVNDVAFHKTTGGGPQPSNNLRSNRKKSKSRSKRKKR
jgi:hypothetical protein